MTIQPRSKIPRFKKESLLWRSDLKIKLKGIDTVKLILGHIYFCWSKEMVFWKRDPIRWRLLYSILKLRVLSRLITWVPVYDPSVSISLKEEGNLLFLILVYRPLDLLIWLHQNHLKYFQPSFSFYPKQLLHLKKLND